MVDIKLKKIEKRMRKTNRLLRDTIKDDMKQDNIFFKTLKKNNQLEKENRILKKRLKRRNK